MWNLNCSANCSGVNRPFPTDAIAQKVHLDFLLHPTELRSGTVKFTGVFTKHGDKYALLFIGVSITIPFSSLYTKFGIVSGFSSFIIPAKAS